MEVILLESLNKLGGIGDLVTVKDGYARNYLIPQKKALRANDENKEYFSKIKQDLVEKNKKIIEDAKLTVQKISKLDVILSEMQVIMDSYMAQFHLKMFLIISLKKINIKPSNVNFHDAIKKIGIYDINIRLHPEVGCNLKLILQLQKKMQRFKKMSLKNQKKNRRNANLEKISAEKNESLHSSENKKKKILHQQLKIKQKVILLRKK